MALRMIRVPALLTIGGATIYALARDSLSPNNPAAANYGDLVKVLSDHFKPKVILIYERYKFYSRNQKGTETVAEFVAGIKALAHTCSFGDQLNDMLRDRFVMGLSSSETQHTLLAEADLTFKRAVEIATAREAARRDVHAMGMASTVHSIQFSKPAKPKPQKYRSDPSRSKSVPNTACSGCGQLHWRRDCPHRDSECYTCGRKGHLKKYCFMSKSNRGSSNATRSNDRGSFKSRESRVNSVSHSSLKKDEPSCYDYVFHVNVNFHVKPIVETVLLNSVPVSMEIDTGAARSLMPRTL